MVGAMGWSGPQWRSPGGSCGLVGFPEEVRGQVGVVCRLG